MFAAINAWTFQDSSNVAEQLQTAAQAGFEGIELVLSHDGPLRFQTPDAACAEFRAQAAELGLQICGLASGVFFETNYASPDAADRQTAFDLTVAMLDRAAALGAGAILVIPAVVGTDRDRKPRVGYADALHRTCDALDQLRYEAEARRVVIGLENVWNRFLLSPVEAAELIDRVNSPWVGMYLDIGNVMAYGYPQDWIVTLGGRILRVHVKDYDLARPGRDGFCPLGEGCVDWPAVIGALRQSGYRGPLTFEGPGEPQEIRRRLGNLIAGRPVLEPAN